MLDVLLHLPKVLREEMLAVLELVKRDSPLRMLNPDYDLHPHTQLLKSPLSPDSDQPGMIWKISTCCPTKKWFRLQEENLLGTTRRCQTSLNAIASTT
jgi:hypothetical protein